MTGFSDLWKWMHTHVCSKSGLTALGILGPYIDVRFLRALLDNAVPSLYYLPPSNVHVPTGSFTKCTDWLFSQRIDHSLILKFKQHVIKFGASDYCSWSWTSCTLASTTKVVMFAPQATGSTIEECSLPFVYSLLLGQLLSTSTRRKQIFYLLL